MTGKAGPVAMRKGDYKLVMETRGEPALFDLSKADLVVDFQFSGGKLANGGTWSAANYVMLDGFSDRVENGPFYNILLNKNCKQPGFMGAIVKTNGQFHARPNTITRRRPGTRW